MRFSSSEWLMPLYSLVGGYPHRAVGRRDALVSVSLRRQQHAVEQPLLLAAARIEGGQRILQPQKIRAPFPLGLQQCSQPVGPPRDLQQHPGVYAVECRRTRRCRGPILRWSVVGAVRRPPLPDGDCPPLLTLGIGHALQCVRLGLLRIRDAVLVAARTEVVVALDWTSFAADGQDTIVLSMVTGGRRNAPF